MFNQQLPSNVLSKILEFVVPRNLFELSQVNQHWRKAVKEFGVIRINFSTCKNKKIKQCMVSLHEQLKKVKCATVRYILVDSFSYLPSSVFNRLQQLCPNVIYFDYSRQQSTSLHTRHSFLSQKSKGNDCTIWKKLRHLPGCHRDTAKAWAPHYGQQLFSLYARIDDFAVATVAKKEYLVMTLTSMPWLTYIVIDIRKKIDERTINNLHAQCPRLFTLHIKYAQLNLRLDRGSPGQMKSPIVVSTLKELTLDHVMFSSFSSLLYFSLKYTNIQTLVLLLNLHSIPPGADRKNEKKTIRRHLYLLITSLKYLKDLTVYLDDWFAAGSPVLKIWPGKEICKWRTTAAGKKIQKFEIKYGDIKVKLIDLLT